jgi:hypothetical protein
MPYRQATSTLRCVDDPRSVHYNGLAEEAKTKKDWSSAEDMRWEDELYRFAVWAGYNDTPVAFGGGSCIFLHLRSGSEATTAGCTAFEPEPMERLLRWLDFVARPVLVQLPDGEYRERAREWGLPEARPRARDLGLAPGVFPPGPLNAITDVPGVRVGQTTLVAGESVRIGVTAVLLRGEPLPGEGAGGRLRRQRVREARRVDLGPRARHDRDFYRADQHFCRRHGGRGRGGFHARLV